MNAVDIAVVVVLLASGVFALMRGFVYETLAMAGWIGAGLVAMWGLPVARPFVHPYIANATMADIAAGAALFMVTLLVCSLITHAISRRVQRSVIGSVDRSLGFAFGLLRGLVLASLCFMVVTRLMTPEPEVLASAKSRPLLKTGAAMILALAPSSLLGVEDRAREAADALDQAQQAKDVYDRLQSPKPRSSDQSKDAKQSPAYDTPSLERLIENTK